MITIMMKKRELLFWYRVKLLKKAKQATKKTKQHGIYLNRFQKIDNQNCYSKNNEHEL